MRATCGRKYGAVAALAGMALVVLTEATTAQETEHAHVKVARADILRLVPDATDIRLTRPGCPQDVNTRCMVCATAIIKGQKRIGAVVVRQNEVEDNTFDPRQPPMSGNAEAGLRAVCKW